MLIAVLLIYTTALAKSVPKTACDPAIPGCSTCETPPGGEQTCTGCTDGGQKVRPDRKGCIDECPADSNEREGICTCAETHQPSGDGLTCVLKAACNTPNCKACDNPKTDKEVCTECNGGNYLTPTNQCVPDCTAIGGYHGDADKKCKKCNSECAECVGPASNQCSACPTGKALTYTNGEDPTQGGACGDACTVDKNGCKACGAKIGGTDYCSQCSVGTQAPLNGVCTANARAQFCAQVTEGSCTSCSGGYFLKNGGCYQADRQPGKQICTLADSKGGCETCANGLPPSSSDVCPSCHPTCKTCSVASNPDKCTSCAAGYYMVGLNDGTCTSCERDSGNVKGVSGCLSCDPPSNSQGTVLCYLTKDDSTGGSTNRSGLSMGAIAGISVAVVIVVGGLVGFLCWWFLCRG
ncbi:VSP, partial [Giardia lamblia P15]